MTSTGLPLEQSIRMNNSAYLRPARCGIRAAIFFLLFVPFTAKNNHKAHKRHKMFFQKDQACRYRQSA